MDSACPADIHSDSLIYLTHRKDKVKVIGVESTKSQASYLFNKNKDHKYVPIAGYIISSEWADNSYVIHINPLLEVIPERDIIEEHAPIRERWREDLQLFSDYLDMKVFYLSVH